jgi:SulP family sulfate permease
MPIEEPAQKNLLLRYLPILGWLPRYRWGDDLRWDLIAGLTVWALLVPEAMAYAGIAGVPPEAGLYTAPLALVGYAIFGTSKQLFVGPSSTVAIVSASVVGGIVASSGADFWTVTSWLAIVTGIVLVVLGVARMGWVSNFMARPVLDGFIIGLAITIAIGQIDKMFGIESEGSNTVREFGSILRQFSDWDVPTMIVGFASLAVLFLMHRYTPRIPAALTVVIGSIVLSAVLGFEDLGIHIVGEIPAGLPSLGIPVWPEGVPLGDLVLGAIAVTIVAYAESLAAAKTYARKHGYLVDSNQELIGLGVANFGAGISQGFVVDGSLSKTAAGDGAGQRTQMAGLTAAILTVITLLFLTGLFFSLPEATLGAIVVHAVWNLIDFGKLKRMWNVRKEDFWAASFALAGVLLFGVLEGILIGIMLSLLILIYRASFPTATELGRFDVGGRQTYVSLEEFPDISEIPEVGVHRFNADLIFSNADYFGESVVRMLYQADPPGRVAVIDCEMMADMDMTGAARLSELVEELRDRDVDVRLARLHGSAREVALRFGVLDEIGDDHIHLTTAGAVRAAQEELSEQPAHDSADEDAPPPGDPVG